MGARISAFRHTAIIYAARSSALLGSWSAVRFRASVLLSCPPPGSPPYTHRSASTTDRLKRIEISSMLWCASVGSDQRKKKIGKVAQQWGSSVQAG